MKSLTSRRNSTQAFASFLVCFIGFTGAACSGTPSSAESMVNTSKPSLINAWNIQLRPEASGQVQLSFRPLVSSAKKVVGADHRSDGKTLWVTIKSCPVNEDCTAMSPAQPLPESNDRFTYRVVLPYQGERVMVQGQGGQPEELPLTR